MMGREQGVAKDRLAGRTDGKRPCTTPRTTGNWPPASHPWLHLLFSTSSCIAAKAVRATRSSHNSSGVTSSPLKLNLYAGVVGHPFDPAISSF